MQSGDYSASSSVVNDASNENLASSASAQHDIADELGSTEPDQDDSQGTSSSSDCMVRVKVAVD